MFIKIKLEPQSSKVLSSLKKISYFSIEDDATILNLKMKIEEYVNVPAERQEIRTLINIFQNSWYVKEVCDVQGSAIMLYSYDECSESEQAQFVCFLQVYTNEIAAQQQELEQRSKLVLCKTTPTTLASPKTLSSCSDTDRDSGETDTETTSSKSSDFESSGSTNNLDSCSKKRSKRDARYCAKNKRLKRTAKSQNLSETLCQYLEEFPKCSKEINSSEYITSDQSQDQRKETIAIELNSLCKSSKTDEVLPFPETSCIQTSITSKLENVVSNKVQSNIVTTTKHKPKSSIVHPCYFINPEIRDYLVIISSSDMDTISYDKFEELLAWFFDQFRACDSLKNLVFDYKNAVSLFEGKLWIACMNENTFDWISANVIKYTLKSYMILPLKDYKHVCEVTIPVVSNSKNFLDVFDILEKQNNNISTLTWSLQSHQPLLAEDKDFDEKAVSSFCSNELLYITMDTESRNYLEKLNFKLKYCFWQIIFKFT